MHYFFTYVKMFYFNRKTVNLQYKIIPYKMENEIASHYSHAVCVW